MGALPFLSIGTQVLQFAFQHILPLEKCIGWRHLGAQGLVCVWAADRGLAARV